VLVEDTEALANAVVLADSHDAVDLSEADREAAGTTLARARELREALGQP